MVSLSLDARRVKGECLRLDRNDGCLSAGARGPGKVIELEYLASLPLQFAEEVA